MFDYFYGDFDYKSVSLMYPGSLICLLNHLLSSLIAVLSWQLVRAW